jgi:hypothetical protein
MSHNPNNKECDYGNPMGIAKFKHIICVCPTTCDHQCSSDYRRKQCNCACGSWHVEKPKMYQCKNTGAGASNGHINGKPCKDCQEITPKQDWEERFDHEFNAHHGEGRVVVNEKVLKDFIRQLRAEARKEERESIVTEFVDWANTNRHYFDKSLGEPVLGVILSDLLSFADSLKKKSMKKKTKKKDVAFSLTPKELEVIVGALLIIEAGYGMWSETKRQRKFVQDLLNKIAP